MDMHRRRRRWHNQQNEQPPSATTALARSPQRIKNDRVFSHHSSQTNGTDAAHNEDFNNFYSETNKEQVEENITNDGDSDDDNDDDPLANVLSLKLRKPKHWKWELTTSKSCSNIALPRILLYDHKGQLLVDAQHDGNGESIYRQDASEKTKRDRSKKRSHDKQQRPQQEPLQRSATTNLTHSIRKALENEFNGLQIQEATPSPEPTYSQASSQSRRSRKAVDFNTTDLPDYSLSRRSSSLRGVRFNVNDDDDDDYYLPSHIPEFLPTPPSTITTPTSSSSGPREKRKYRRSHSSGRSSAHSESILERFSYQKGRFSSPEYAEEHDIDHGPRYFLCTSKAGTLVVQEDSFRKHPQRRRRKPIKNRSTESLQKSQASSTPPAQHLFVNHSPTPSEINRRKIKPIRRNNTDGNILLNKKQSSLSDGDDVAAVVGVERKHLLDNVNSSSRHLRKYAEERNRAKGE